MCQGRRHSAGLADAQCTLHSEELHRVTYRLVRWHNQGLGTATSGCLAELVWWGAPRAGPSLPRPRSGCSPAHLALRRRRLQRERRPGSRWQSACAPSPGPGASLALELASRVWLSPNLALLGYAVPCNHILQFLPLSDSLCTGSEHVYVDL